MKKQLRITITLLLTGLCCLGVLFLVHALTKDKINDQKLASVRPYLEEIYPNGEFKELDFKDDNKMFKAVYAVKDQGYVFKLGAFGFSSNEILFMAGFDQSGNITGLVAIEHSETPGYGSKAFETEYIGQLKNVSNNDALPLISGATKTTSGITKALEYAKSLIGKVGN